VKVSKLWDNPAAKPFRDWVATQKDGVLEAMVGVPFADIDRVTVFVPTVDSREDEEEPVTLVTTRQKYTDADVLKAFAGGLGGGKELQLKGRAVRLPGGAARGPFRTALLVNDRTLAFSSAGLDEKEASAVLARLTPRKGDGPLAGALAEARTHDIVAAVNLRTLEPFADRLAKDKEAAPFLVLLKAKIVILSADVDKTAKGKVVLTFPDAGTAKQAAKALEEGMKMIAAEFTRERDRARGNPFEKFIAGRFVDVVTNAKVTVDGSNVIAAADVAFADDLEKAVAALPKSLKEYIAEMTAQNNLKQLGIGMHNFNDALGKLPGDVGLGDKAPAMSWRVQLLPYIEQDNIARQLDPTKPWDDPKNLKVLEATEMPKVFEHPGRPAPKGHTYYRIFTLPKNAKGTERPLFKEGERGPTIQQISALDGTSLTFMVVEAGEAVPWYKPDVLPYDGKLPLPQLGAKDADTFLVALCDGSVRKINRKLDEKTLRALITMNGGETVPDLDK
jgi:hypothetical protein